MPPHSEGCRGHIVFGSYVCAYVFTNVRPSIRDPVRLRLKFLLQVARRGNICTMDTFLVFLGNSFKANRVDFNQILRSATSDIGLLCLLLIPLMGN